MNVKEKPVKKTKARRPPKILYIFVGVTHDPYDNSIGGPNDYAYGM